MPFANWQPAERCADGATPGARVLMRWILDNYPESKNLGIFNCRPVRGSADRKSIHAEGRALDVGFSGRSNPRGSDLVEQLRLSADTVGIQAVIWNRRIWSAKSPDRDGRPYPGVHPHYDHVHIELTREAGGTLTLETLNRIWTTTKPRAGGKPSATDKLVPGGRTLRLGDSGPDVATLQRFLGMGLKVDGKFGPYTETAVRRYQRLRGLPQSGVCGDRTWDPILDTLRGA